MNNPILDLAEKLLDVVEDKTTPLYTKQLVMLASETIIKQYELLEKAAKMVDQSIHTLNMIVDNKIKTIH